MKALIDKLINLIRSILKLAGNIWVTRAYLILLVAGIGYCLYEYRDKLDIEPETLRPGMIAAALLLSYAAYLFYVFIHYSSYLRLGVDISFRQALQVLSISRLGVYFPGKVWCATNYYLFSRSFGISTDTIGKNFVINNALLLFTGALMSFLVVAELNAVARRFLYVLPVLMLILIHPRVLNKIFSFVIPHLSRLSGESCEAVKVSEGYNWSYSTYLLFIVYYLVLWMLGGAILFVCVKSFGEIGFSKIPITLATGAVSLVLALLAVFAPAGVGVREGVGVAMISQVVPIKTAVLAFLLLRLSQIIVDLSVGLIGVVGFMRIRKKEAVDAGS